MVLGATVAAEVLGKTLLSTGIASSFRPKKYYTLSQATLNTMLSDATELINFFVIESQRILFAENVLASSAVSFPPPSPHIWLIILGLRCSFPLLLLDQGCAILGHVSHRDLRSLPDAARLQD